MYEPIFPGMDPFIESQRWMEFHNSLITGIQQALSALLVPQYNVIAETYIYLNMRPDVSVHRGRAGTEPFEQSSLAIADATRVITPAISDPDNHTSVEIRDDEGKLVTVVEVLSPANKGKHRDRYLANRDSILYSDVHLIEIDLLRGGQRMEAEISTEGYAIFVARSQTDSPHRGELYEIGLRDALPVIPVPLKPGDPDVPLDMPGLFRNLYIQSRYRLQLDYTRPVKPTLSPDDQIWVDAILKAAFPDR